MQNCGHIQENIQRIQEKVAHLEKLSRFNYHVTVTSDGASFAGRMADTSCRQTHQTNSFAQLSLSVQFEQCNIIVQRLAIVIMMNVSGCDAHCLRTRAAIFPCQIIVTDSNINGITRSYNTKKSNIKHRFSWPSVNISKLLQSKSYLVTQCAAVNTHCVPINAALHKY